MWFIPVRRNGARGLIGWHGGRPGSGGGPVQFVGLALAGCGAVLSGFGGTTGLRAQGVATGTKLVFSPPAAAEKGPKVVLLSGDEEYRSEEALPMLGRMLSERFGLHCVVLFAIDPESGEIRPDCQTNIPDLDELENADLVIMALRFRNLPDGQMEHIDRYLRRGRPLIGLRTSTHAFHIPSGSPSGFRHYSFDAGPPWPGGFGRQILGETWISHHGEHGRQSTRGVPAAELADHPVLRGVDDVWGPTDVYGVTRLPGDAVVLMHGQVLEGMTADSKPVDGRQNDPMMPLVWCREIPVVHDPLSAAEDDRREAAPASLVRQRVVCTTMGAATDFESPGLRRLIANAALWCLGREEAIDGTADVSLDWSYDPSPFGFGGYRRGLRPADLAGN